MRTALLLFLLTAGCATSGSQGQPGPTFPSPAEEQERKAHLFENTRSKEDHNQTNRS